MLELNPTSTMLAAVDQLLVSLLMKISRLKMGPQHEQKEILNRLNKDKGACEEPS